MLPTWDLVDSLKQDRHFQVVDGVTDPNEEFAIWKPLNEHWTTDDIIIIGQDNLPTYKMLLELDKCRHAACVNPCLSYPPSTALDKVYQNQIVYTKNSQRLLLPNERPVFVDYAGTGVCKISKNVQLNLPLKNNPCSFPMLDSTIEALRKIHLPSLKWHTHYPLHVHMKQEMKDAHWI